MANPEAPDTQQKNTDPLPPATKEDTGGQAQKPTKDREHSANINQIPMPIWWRDKEKRELVLIGATLLLAIFTAWMAWETHKLSEDSAKQVDAASISAKATERAATATEHSAIAAENYVAITKQSLGIAETSIAVTKRNARITETVTKMDLRAYLVLNDISVSGTRVGENPKATVSVKNIGKTPAYRVSIWSFWKIGNGIDNEDMNRLIKPVLDTGFFIGSGTDYGFDRYFSEVLTTQDSILLQTGVVSLYFFCRVAYVDKFNEVQFSQKCFVYRPRQHDMISLRKCDNAS